MAPQFIPHEVLDVEQAVLMAKPGEGSKLVSQIIPSSVGCHNLGETVGLRPLSGSLYAAVTAPGAGKGSYPLS